MLFKSVVGTALALCAFTAEALNAIAVQGQNFVDTVTNHRFDVIGITYQPGGSASYKPEEGRDALSNADNCLRDAALMQRLGVNVIRVYNLDPYLNHDGCASIFNAVGIYMLLDVNSPLPNESINQDDPASSYNVGYLNRTFALLDAFRGYSNTLGFFGANELISTVANAKNAPYIRAVQRDLNNYLTARGGQNFPIGYAATDVRVIVPDNLLYLECVINGDMNDPSRSKFFGLNSYSWCGSNATFDSSGYDDIVALFSDSTIPTLFAEYGCNTPRPRTFDEVPVIYGPQMAVMSGGLVYEYSEEPNDFGLVQIYSNGSAQLLRDYDTLQSQYGKLDFNLIESRNSTAVSLDPPTCSPDLISNAGFSKDFNLPDVPEGVADLISNGVGIPTGSFVPITQTLVPQSVYDSNGQLIRGLQITPTGSANAPAAATGVSSSSSSTSHSTSQRSMSSAVSSAAISSSGSSGGSSSHGLAAPTSVPRAAALGFSLGSVVVLQALIA